MTAIGNVINISMEFTYPFTELTGLSAYCTYKIFDYHCIFDLNINNICMFISQENITVP